MTKEDTIEAVCQAIHDGLVYNRTYQYQEPADCFCQRQALPERADIRVARIILINITDALKCIDFKPTNHPHLKAVT